MSTPDYSDKTKYNLQQGFLTGEAPEIWRDPTEPQALHTWANSWLLWKYPQYNSLLIEKGLYPEINFQRIGVSTYNEVNAKREEIGKWKRDLTDRGLTFYGRIGTILPIKEVEQDDIRIKMIQNKESFQKGEPLRHTFEEESRRDKVDYLAISMKQLGVKTIEEEKKGRAKKPDSVFSSFEPTGTLNETITSIIPSIPEAQASGITVPESATIGFDNITENSVLVFWNPHGDGGSPITSYHVMIKNQDTGQTILQQTIGDPRQPSPIQTNLFVQNLDSGTNYKAYVIVINAIGNSFEQSYGFKTLGITPTAPAPEPTPTPTAEPAPTPAPIITYCVNVYTLDSGGNVLSDHYDKINLSNLQNLLSENKYVFYCKDGIIPTEQQVRDFYGYTAPVEDSSINSMMVSQSVGAFILKDGRLKGEILYIANTAFNPFYYNKNLTSLVQIKSKTGVPIAVKPNNLNFTNTERDERIQIDESVGNFKELIVDFFVWKSTTDLRQFSADKQIQVVEELPPPDEPDFKPCPMGYHKDFNGNCVQDDPLAEIPRDKLIDTLKGFLFGTVALSLLARKY